MTTQDIEYDPAFDDGIYNIDPAQIEQEQRAIDISAYVEMTNIAESLDNSTLAAIGSRVCEDYQIDVDSRQDWEARIDTAIELAQLLKSERTWAGETVANIMYPALTTACIQFAIRAMPAIIRGKEVVKGKVIGSDQQGIKQLRAERIASHMSWQLLEQIEGWVTDTDCMLLQLPLIGCAFRKTYYDVINQRPVSEIVDVKQLVVHYYAKSLADATRITQIIELTPNQVVERVRAGIFRDVELGEPQSNEEDKHADDDEDSPHVFYEQHRWWDLDEDGYQEPYIVTVHRDTEQVVRITARYDEESITSGDDGTIIRIDPIQYFTRYLFMPSFDGGFYGMGYGSLLMPLNKTINTIINQLLDAGSLSNRQGGFLGAGIRLGRNQSTKFKIGEWKHVQNTGDDLRKGIVPLPTHEPSPTLFNLLNTMIDVSKEVSSISDVLTGEQPAANVPATTVLAMIEQSLKAFSAIYQRIHRSLKAEFSKLRRLNKIYLSDNEYRIILDDPQATVADYVDADLDIVPVSDEAELTDIQRIAKANSLLELSGRGLNDIEIMKRYLESLGIDHIEALLPQGPPPSDPQIELEQEKLSIERERLSLEERKIRVLEDESVEKMLKTRADAIKAIADAEAKELGPQIAVYQDQINEMAVEMDIQDAVIRQAKQKQGGVNDTRGIPGVESSPGNSGGNERGQGASGQLERGVVSGADLAGLSGGNAEGVGIDSGSNPGA
jgi:chaperonin GroES